MVKKMVNTNGTKIDVAVIKNDLNWLKKEIGEIKSITTNTNKCVEKNDGRIQTLEDWQGFTKDQFNKGIAKAGAAIGIVSVIITIIINFMI